MCFTIVMQATTKARHWIACSVLVLLTACGESPPATESPAADTQQIAELRAKLDELKARKTRIEDSNAIKRLQRAYGYYMEEALWDEVVQLFADDATLEFARDGVYSGKERIREYLYAFGKGRQGLQEGQLHDHLELMPVLTFNEDGQSAKARWNTIMLIGQYGEDARWGEGPYENEYVKVDGVWKFSKLRWFQTILVPYEGGWAKSEDLNHGIWVSDKLPPDAPPTAPYKWWPETFLPPFSFPNPVGRYVPPAAPETPATEAAPAAGAQQ
jgi:hypothetical protein